MNVRFLKNSDPRFHLVETRAKWFFGLTVLIACVLVGLAMWRLEWFRPVQRLVLVGHSGEGIQPGMPVQLSGFRIGSVKGLDLESADRVRVRVDLFKEYARYVRKDSDATVASGSLIGDRYITLTSGTAASALVAEGDELHLVAENSIGRMVEALKDEVKPLVQEMRESVKYLNDPDGDLRTSVRQLRVITNSLQTEVPPALADTRDAAKKIDGFFTQLADPDQSLQKALAKFEEAASAMSKDMPGLLEKFDKSLGKFELVADDTRKLMKDADDVVQDLHEVVAKAGPQVPGLVTKGKEAARKADDVIDSVRGMWPVRKGVRQDKDKMLRVDSED